ncbi:DUF167 domain-containing protein [Sporomusa termitida]|uniref:UPF0235 protein SPTER_20300 n=1 Tax=Sporomusa termitida TaxID=2377 RepID=A0A517DTM4_9FIRM|nr:DUF167 domain-containing protein [Sporomusa termitida]QDR80699.1 TIGR00251: family protein [Sporomusa termitida]
MPDQLDIKELPDGVSFKVRVQPRSSKNAVSGIMGDSIKINLTSPPVDGEANAACIAFIAGLFKVSRSSVVITSGHRNRSKTVKVTGIDKNIFCSIIAAYI